MSLIQVDIIGLSNSPSSGGAYALVLGEQELAEERIGCKPLRSDDEQESIALAELAAVMQEKLKSA